MESSESPSRKDTLIAFRIPSKDIEFFKRRAAAGFKRGEIKTPTVAALCKRNLYWTCNIQEDLDKAETSLDEQLHTMSRSNNCIPGRSTPNSYRYYYDYGHA